MKSNMHKYKFENCKSQIKLQLHLNWKNMQSPLTLRQKAFNCNRQNEEWLLSQFAPKSV